MCRLAIKLLLHLNSKFTGLNGYGMTTTAAPSSLRATAQSNLVMELLYATSGCLLNIARHPRNHFTLFGVELEVKTRRAAEDLLLASETNVQKVDGTNSALPSARAYQGDVNVGIMQPAGNSALLRGDHVRGLSSVKISNVDLSEAQKAVSKNVTRIELASS
jgi:hypothetical protein